MSQATVIKGVQPAAPCAVLSTRSPPRPVYNDDSIIEEGGNALVLQALGTLGLLEAWVFIIFVLGSYVSFTPFEKLLLGTLAVFELAGYVPTPLTWCYLMNNTTAIDRAANWQTVSRDPFHNLAYPRSAPRSRKRRDFAGIAWYSLYFTVIPVVLLVSFYPLWWDSFDDPLYVRIVPSVLAVLAILMSVAGFLYADTNKSSLVLTVLYGQSKLISLFVLLCSAERLVLGEDEAARSTVMGLLLVCLQVVKAGSACMAAAGYLRGKADEDMPGLNCFWDLLVDGLQC